MKTLALSTKTLENPELSKQGRLSYMIESRLSYMIVDGKLEKNVLMGKHVST